MPISKSVLDTFVQKELAQGSAKQWHPYADGGKFILQNIGIFNWPFFSNTPLSGARAIWFDDGKVQIKFWNN